MGRLSVSVMAISWMTASSYWRDCEAGAHRNPYTVTVGFPFAFDAGVTDAVLDRVRIGEVTVFQPRYAMTAAIGVSALKPSPQARG